MRNGGFILAALLFAGCAAFKPGPNDAVAKAVVAGQDAADLTCTAISVKASPGVKLQVTDGLAKAETVLSSDNITSAALLEALGAVKDEQWRGIAQAGLRVLLRRVNGGEVPVTIAKDSPAAAGVLAFVVGCQEVLGVKA